MPTRIVEVDLLPIEIFDKSKEHTKAPQSLHAKIILICAFVEVSLIKEGIVIWEPTNCSRVGGRRYLHGRPPLTMPRRMVLMSLALF